MKKSKAAALLTALVMCSSMALTACGSKTGDSEATAAETNPSAAENDSTTATEETEASPEESGTDDADTKKYGDETENTLTANEAIVLMGNGINLGNTMEAYGHKQYLSGSDPTSFETIWGQPVTTKEMIEGMKAAGFDTLRIPVAWTNGMNFESGDYTIDERLMDRVDQIVTWALDADMYVIVNDHWDGSWWGMFGSETQETRDKAMEMYKAMWDQITDRFGDYSYKLIFESANEELGDRLNDKDIAEDSGSL